MGSWGDTETEWVNNNRKSTANTTGEKNSDTSNIIEGREEQEENNGDELDVKRERKDKLETMMAKYASAIEINTNSKSVTVLGDESPITSENLKSHTLAPKEKNILN